MNRTRVLAADDHPAVLERVCSELEPQFAVVGMVANGRDLLVEEKQLHPDVVILDISMPELGGLEAATQLRASGSKAKIIFLTVQDRPEFVRAAFNAGALGYVLKNSLTADLIPSIRKVLAGHRYISPSLQVRVDQIKKEES